MRVTAAFLGLMFVSVVIVGAQTTRSDEEQIRALIAKFETGPNPEMFTQDRIVWSGAFKRPVVGPQKGEEVPSDRRLSERVPGSQRGKATPVRIEVAKSGDLAYEFSNGEMSFELKNGKKESFSHSVLRVWKKDAGQWKIAAMFAHPHYQEPARQ